MPESAIPAEIWSIQHDNGHLVPPCDDDGTHGFMAWPSREEAERGLKHQLECGYIDSGEVVRLK